MTLGFWDLEIGGMAEGGLLGLPRDVAKAHCHLLCCHCVGMVKMPTPALGEVTLTQGHHTDLRVSCLPNSAAD